MESKTCEIKDKIKLEVDFPEDVEDYHNYRLALNIIKNITGASIKIVLQMNGNPDQLEETRKLISKIKFSDKVQPLKTREFDMGVQEIKNYFLSKLNEFKITYQDAIVDLKNDLEAIHTKISESNELHQKLESDIMDMINRLLKAKMELQENEIETRNMQFETLFNAINSNTEEIQRIKENFQSYQKEVDQIDNVDLDAFFKSRGYMYCMANNGAQPLHIASKLGRLDVVKKLLKTGAYIDVKDAEGWTPLYYASESGHLNVVQHLISKKARIDDQTVWGFTALSRAVSCRCHDVVEFLCSQNAALHIRDHNNISAIDIAYLHQDHEMIHILQKYSQPAQ